MTREAGGKMRVVMLGAPGAGKGTQAKRLAEILGVPQISTGDIFRKNISEGTELGLKAKDSLDRGLLVSDDITNGIVKNRILEEDCKDGFILDGYPRTLSQAKYFESIARSFDMNITAAINVNVPDDVIIKRLSGRRTCKGCGLIYHIEAKPPADSDKCDVCGSALELRIDDKPETVAKRLEVYHSETSAVLDFYMEQGKLVTVDGAKDIGMVFEDIKTALGIKR